MLHALQKRAATCESNEARSRRDTTLLRHLERTFASTCGSHKYLGRSLRRQGTMQRLVGRLSLPAGALAAGATVRAQHPAQVSTLSGSARFEFARSHFTNPSSPPSLAHCSMRLDLPWQSPPLAWQWRRCAQAPRLESPSRIGQQRRRSLLAGAACPQVVRLDPFPACSKTGSCTSVCRRSRCSSTRSPRP